MKLNKMILRLERHTFAPELNTLVFVNGARICVPNCETIQKAKKRLFARKTTSNRYVNISVCYPKQFNYCDKTYKGCFNSSIDLKKFIDSVKQKHIIDVDELCFKPEGFSGVIKPEIKINFKKMK